jgi:hypothetical protein
MPFANGEPRVGKPAVRLSFGYERSGFSNTFLTPLGNGDGVQAAPVRADAGRG